MILLTAIILLTSTNLVLSTESRLLKLEEKIIPLAIVNKLTQFCLTSEIGKDVFLSKCQGFASQLWFEEFDKNNSIVLTNRENGKVLASKDIQKFTKV